MAKKSRGGIADDILKDSDMLDALKVEPAMSIVMVPLEDISFNKKNFYNMDPQKLAELMENIHLIGLQHPIRVEEIQDGKYVSTGGERRIRAFFELRKKYGEKYSRIPATIASVDDIPLPISRDLKEQFVLISSNCFVRDRTPEERLKEIEICDNVFDALEEQGFELPGRRRDLIAEKMNISPRTVSSLQKIYKHGTEEEKQAFIEGASAAEVEKAITERTRASEKTSEKNKSGSPSAKKMKNIPSATLDVISSLLGDEFSPSVDSVYSEETIAEIKSQAKKAQQAIQKLRKLLSMQEG